jgi:hypothetical protein
LLSVPFYGLPLPRPYPPPSNVPITVLHESIDCVASSHPDRLLSSYLGCLQMGSSVELRCQLFQRAPYILDSFQPRYCSIAASRVEDCRNNERLYTNIVNGSHDLFYVAYRLIIFSYLGICGLRSSSGVYFAIIRVTGFLVQQGRPGQPSLTASLSLPRDNRILPLICCLQSRLRSSLLFPLLWFHF